MDDDRSGARGPRGGRILLLAAAAATALGCQTVTLDLGSNRTDAGAGTSSSSGGGPVINATCPSLTDSQAAQIEGNTCAATCTDVPGAPRVADSGAALEALVSGKWQTCAGSPPWAADVVGIEFQAGCTLFLLHEAPADAGVVRGVEPDDQGTYDVVETTLGTSVTRSLALHFPAGTWSATPTVTDCPHTLRLAREGASELDFAGLASALPPLD